MILDDVLEDVPDHVLRLFHGALCRLDVMALAAFDQALHDEGFEQLDRHFLGKAALINFQLGPDDDNRTSGIVDSLAQKVLTETPLLTAEHTRQGFELAVGRPAEGLAAAAVVDERVHGFLQHTLFVFDDHFGRADFHHLFQAVVAVDDAAIEIVQVGGGEPPAVQLNHGPDVRRNDRKNGEDHPFGTVAALAEGFHHFQALDRLNRLLPGRIVADELLAFLALFFEIDRHEEFADGFGAHAHFQAGDRAVSEPFLDVAELFVVDHLFIGEFVHFARVENDVGSKIDDLFQLFGSHVEQEPDLGRHAFEIPDVRNGRRQFDVAHSLSADFGTGDFHAAFLADVALVFDSFIFSAMAFPVLHRPEDLFAEQTVAFGLLGAVVDRLRLGDLAVRPFSDFFGRSNADLNGIEIV